MKTALFLLATIVATSEALAHEFPSSDDGLAHDRQLSASTGTLAHGRELRHRNSGESTFLLFVLGLCLFVIAPAFLVGVEQSGVKSSKLLTRARKLTVSDVDASNVQPKLDGHMVHITGRLQLDPAWGDELTGVKFPHAVRVVRAVETYSWTEDEHEVDTPNGTQVQYQYKADWHAIVEDSSKFHSMGAPQNPRPVVSGLDSADLKRPRGLPFGGYTLSPATFDRADWLMPTMLPGDGSVSLAPSVAAQGGTIIDGGVYIRHPNGQPVVPGGPSIGDVKVTYMAAHLPPDGTLSICGVQQGTALRPFVETDASKILGKMSQSTPGLEAELESIGQRAQSIGSSLQGSNFQSANCCAKAGLLCNVMITIVAPLVQMLIGHLIGTDVLLLAPGGASVRAMYAKQEWKIEKLMHVLRIVGCVLFVLAFYFVLHPIAALFAFIPFLKAMLASLFFFAALLLGSTCGLVTIGAAWALVRPARAAVLFTLLAIVYAIGSIGKGAYDVYNGEAFVADGDGYSPHRLPPPASFSDGLYQSAVVATPLSAYMPTIVFGLCAFVSAGLAVKECLVEAKFERAAKAELTALTKPAKGAEML